VGELDERGWREVAASNRERIVVLEREMQRTRDRLHEISGELTAVRYLGEKVADLGTNVRALTDKLETITREALRRPTPTTLGLLGQYGGLVVAIVALVYTLSR
jgi:hypothetical protein